MQIPKGCPRHKGEHMKTVIEMAREAGIIPLNVECDPTYLPVIERFAEMVRADEREACAKVCESMIVETLEDNEWVDSTNDSKARCAIAISARNNT
jgi:hypothetical protein